MKKTIAIFLSLFAMSWSYMFSDDDFHFEQCNDTLFMYCGWTFTCHNKPSISKGCESIARLSFSITEDNIIIYEIRPIILPYNSLDGAMYQGEFKGIIGVSGGRCMEAIDPNDVKISGDTLLLPTPADSLKPFNVPQSDYCMKEMFDKYREKVVKQKMSNYLKGIDFKKILPKIEIPHH